MFTQDKEHKLTDRESEYHKLVDGTVSDYTKVTRKMEMFRAELATKTQECYDQQEHITKLLTQLVDYQREKKELQVTFLYWNFRKNCFTN